MSQTLKLYCGAEAAQLVSLWCRGRAIGCTVVRGLRQFVTLGITNRCTDGTFSATPVVRAHPRSTPLTAVSSPGRDVIMYFTIVGVVSSVQTIAAGSGIREKARLRKVYGRGRWLKRKGVAQVRLASGEIAVAEIHWYECAGIGKREFKIKAQGDAAAHPRHPNWRRPLSAARSASVEDLAFWNDCSRPAAASMTST